MAKSATAETEEYSAMSEIYFDEEKREREKGVEKNEIDFLSYEF